MNPVGLQVPSSSPVLDVERVRRDFPALHQEVHGHPLVYLDNAATTQKPEVVLRELDRFLREDNANIHRGLHRLSERATAVFEAVRAKTARFLNAADPSEVVFVRGATEAVNLVAQTFGRQRVGQGDEVLITHMEHHSNIVPWQLLCDEKRARLQVAAVDDAGELRLEDLEAKIGPRTRLVAVTHVSNALGTVNPVGEIVRIAHARGVPVLVDGAQALAHRKVDVQEIGCDFYAGSAHKMYGPTGLGFLYGRRELLDSMPPWQGGGEMVTSVTFGRSFFQDPPHRFEAGTPAIAEVAAFGPALDYLEALGWEALQAHEKDLLEHGIRLLLEIPGVRLVGTAKERCGVLSFVHETVHPHDLGTLVDREGVAIRAGHHCAQPVMERFGVPATARASFGVYNTRGDVDRLAAAVRKALEIFA